MKFISTKNIPFILLFVFLCCVSATIFAEKSTQIYRWVDKDGQVHYSERARDKSAVKMDKLGKNYSTKKEVVVNTTTQDREKKCLEAKNTKKKYKAAPFLFRTDKKYKKQIRLTEQESKEAFLRLDKNISYWCNPPLKDSEI